MRRPSTGSLTGTKLAPGAGSVGCAVLAMGVLIAARMTAVSTTATRTLTSWSALKGPTNGLRQFIRSHQRQY